MYLKLGLKIWRNNWIWENFKSRRFNHRHTILWYSHWPSSWIRKGTYLPHIYEIEFRLILSILFSTTWKSQSLIWALTFPEWLPLQIRLCFQWNRNVIFFDIDYIFVMWKILLKRFKDNTYFFRLWVVSTRGVLTFSQLLTW